MDNLQLDNAHTDILNRIRKKLTLKDYVMNNGKKIGFLHKNKFITYDTSVYPQELELTERGKVYLETGRVLSELVFRKRKW